MTARYVRKSVPLEIRAVQKIASSHQQQHNVPLPEAAEEELQPDYITSVNRAIVSYHAYSRPGSSSGGWSPANQGAQSLRVSHGGWTTGNTTERSTSVDSSCYSLNEFDRQAASTVNHHFEEFESMLFEGPKETGSSVYKECQEWLTQFPHLRVLGHQLMAPTDVGYNFVTSGSSATLRPSTTETLELGPVDHGISAGSDIQGLSLVGRKVKASTAPAQSGRASLQSRGLSQRSNQNSSDFDFLHEEVFAQDGIYEDIIAVDYKDIYEDNMEHKKQITPRRRHVGYPPITPNASVKDSVLGGIFDQMWSEIISWLWSLLRRYSQEMEAKKSASLLEQVLAPQRPVRASSFVLSPRDAQDEMLPLLQVSKMALRDRNSHSMSSADMAESAVLGESSQTPLMPMQQMVPTSRPSTMHHPRRRLSYSQHLDPLREPSKILSMDEGRSMQPSPQNALRVKQIVPSGPHPLSSPSTSVPSRLPPLESSGIPSHRKLGHRASSAIDNKEGWKQVGRERTITNYEVSRPSTTQAFRSDTPFGGHYLRSSTPMVQSTSARQMNAMGGHSGGLNVMGSGLYPSAVEPSSHVLEDHEGHSMDRHSQWIPSHSSFSFFKPRRTMRN